MISLPNIIKSLQYEKDFLSSFAGIAASEEQRTSKLRRQKEETLADARRQAGKILENAEKTALETLESLKKSAEAENERMWEKSQKEGYEKGLADGKNEGYSLGFQEGYDAGLLRAGNENRYMAECLKEMTQGFLHEKEDVMALFTAGLDDLTLQIAKAVLRREVEIHPEYLAKLAYDRDI